MALDDRAKTVSIPSGIKDEALLAERRALVVEKATELFIARGFAEVSVNEIADFAGISVGSLYKYIRAKEDLLWLVMQSIYGTLEDSLEAERKEAPSPPQALEQTVRRLFAAVDTVSRGILLMYREYRHLPIEGQQEFMRRERRIIHIFRTIVEDGNACEAFHCPHPEMAALDILLAAHAWSLKRWVLPKGRDHSFYVEQQLELIHQMVGA
ncbi:MAG: TetR/AcrR family transcriptional regulator [Dehalococcoidia bacterium]|nr:TetR/AcrR family transcriptional regulator [Dehalococcoidia bacterium]